MSFNLAAFQAQAQPQPPVPGPVRRAERALKRCSEEMVQQAFPTLWCEQFRTRAGQQRKFPWETWKRNLPANLQGQREKLAGALLYLFSRWTNYHESEERTVPLYPLIIGIQPWDADGQRQLLQELRATPRLEEKSCKFLWKDRPTAPDGLGEYGRYGNVVWNNCIVQAEKAALQRIAEWRQQQTEQ